MMKNHLEKYYIYYLLDYYQNIIRYVSLQTTSTRKTHNYHEIEF